jgi:hypothetical protein
MFSVEGSPLRFSISLRAGKGTRVLVIFHTVDVLEKVNLVNLAYRQELEKDTFRSTQELEYSILFFFRIDIFHSLVVGFLDIFTRFRCRQTRSKWSRILLVQWIKRVYLTECVWSCPFWNNQLIFTDIRTFCLCITSSRLQVLRSQYAHLDGFH